jgi:hypothetical protein
MAIQTNSKFKTNAGFKIINIDARIILSKNLDNLMND